MLHTIQLGLTITNGLLIQSLELRLDITNRHYATFKIFDTKNKIAVETSCAQTKISNYFVESVLPWEISPAFFRADVLNKYRSDTENYSLDAQGLSYRDEWDLKMYDFSKTGLVFTYIRYLQPLPYTEQLHWQSFNVWPDGKDLCHHGRVRPNRTGLLFRRSCCL